jgi:hypothetical protein
MKRCELGGATAGASQPLRTRHDAQTPWRNVRGYPPLHLTEQCEWQETLIEVPRFKLT